MIINYKSQVSNKIILKAQTDDSAKAIIQDNSGEKQPQCVAGQPVIGRTDLAQDDFLRNCYSILNKNVHQIFKF